MNKERFVNFGKYKGIKVEDVPNGYIDWFLEKKDSRGFAKRKLKWRRIFEQERALRNRDTITN